MVKPLTESNTSDRQFGILYNTREQNNLEAVTTLIFTFNLLNIQNGVVKFLISTVPFYYYLKFTDSMVNSADNIQSDLGLHESQQQRL